MVQVADCLSCRRRHGTSTNTQRVPKLEGSTKAGRLLSARFNVANPACRSTLAISDSDSLQGDAAEATRRRIGSFLVRLVDMAQTNCDERNWLPQLRTQELSRIPYPPSNEPPFIVFWFRLDSGIGAD